MRDAGREADTTRLLQAGDTTRRCRYRKLMGRDIRSAALHYIPDGDHIAALGVLERSRRELTLAHAVGDHVGVRRLEVPVGCSQPRPTRPYSCIPAIGSFGLPTGGSGWMALPAVLGWTDDFITTRSFANDSALAVGRTAAALLIAAGAIHSSTSSSKT